MSDSEPNGTSIGYQQLADEVRFAIRDALSRIPKSLEWRPKEDTFVRAHRTVPREFVQTLAEDVLNWPDSPFDPQAAREVLQFIDAFRPLRDYLQEMTDRLTYTMEKAYAVVAADGLITYELTKRASKRPDKNTLNIDLQILKKTLGRSTRKKKANTGI